MKYKYQLIFIGGKNLWINKVKEVFFQHINELGLKKTYFNLIDHKNFYKKYRANLPTFTLYFGSEKEIDKYESILTILLNSASFILPVVKNLRKFKNEIPKIIETINGIELSNANDIEPIVGKILEGLGLLRLSRRLFISYKRDESSTVAIQLFERLERAGFDVFLDTHSVRPGEPFQDELWHRLADTDIVVLLNTPGFLNSNWTTKELAQANSMSIGILQLIWPNHKQEREAELSFPMYLTDSNFGNEIYSNARSYLTEKTLKNVVNNIESLRARSLAARFTNMITEFAKFAKKKMIKVNVQPEKFLTIKKSNNKEFIIIPTVGVPQALTFNKSEEMVNQIKSESTVEALLLYDHRNIREKWLKHLAWLDHYLPIKTIKLIETEEWLAKI